MSAFDAIAGSLESAIDRQFAEDGVYSDGQNPPLEVRVIIDRNVEQRDAFETTMPSHRDQIEIRKIYVARPRRGHTVVVGSTTWVFDGLISEDEEVTRHYVNGSES